MFATTKQFDHFNLKSLQQLPPLSEIKELDKVARISDGLDEELGNSRVLELPEDAIDENSYQAEGTEEEELLAVEEAIELSKKPLDEILRIDAIDDADADNGEAGDTALEEDVYEYDEEEYLEGVDTDLTDADDELEPSAFEFSIEEDTDESERD